MLKTLFLKNLVLVEEASVDFKEGLTIITGETGAGKTALIEALRLLLGERADSSKVRKGCEKASVSASFDLPLAVRPVLEKAGIDSPADEELILSREILASGKSRAFVCGQMVPASLLQTLAPYLIDFVGQHAQVLLKSSDQQLRLLDQFIELNLIPFQTAWKEEKELEKSHQTLINSKEASEARKGQLEAQKEELEEANVQEGEDEALFEEYTLLANAQELLVHSSDILTASEEATNRCVEIQKHLGAMLRFDKTLFEAEKMGKEAHFLLSELTQMLQSFQGKMESNPNRLAFLEERLKILDHLKKKYGKNLTGYLATIQQELNGIENLDETLAEMEKKLTLAREKTKKEAQNLRQKREKGARSLATRLSASLRELNIPQAELTLALTPMARSSTGEDAVTFYLRANQGEESVPVKESSSGGELSRLLFSLKLLLSNQAPTLVFDEIDANVGGETATIIGKKLKKLGKEQQILCITHFPQVARQADHHLTVKKKETNGRTRTLIEPLTSTSKEAELLRMLGGTQEALSR